MKLLIIRHAEPDYSIDSLTEKGWIEAEYLSEKLSKMDIKAIYTSMLGRAKDTAAVTLKKMGREADGSFELIKAASEKIVKLRRKRSFIVRFAKFYYTKIIRTPGTPDFVARGWALGVAVGCIVPVFCQLLVAIPLSFVCRCSKIGAIAGTFVTTPPTAIFIYPVLIWIGNKIINGNLSSDSAAELVKIFNDSSYSFVQKWQAFADMGGDLVAAFFAGGVAWAAIMVPLTYFGVRKLVISYRRIREERRAKANAGK
jgi:uncharacterized protein (DUF2062 family)